MSDKPMPTQEENDEAQYRLSCLDAISDKCEWDSIAPTYEGMKARERWNAIMIKQTEYENKYC